MNRYSRQILFDGLQEAGQRALMQSRVAIIGCGALGCMQIQSLARAGVGYLRVIDRDLVEYSNLQRQILFDEQDAAGSIPKAIAAVNHIKNINSEVKIDSVVLNVTASNIEKLITDVDLVLDGTDNFETRFLINDACVKNSIPWIYAAAVGSFGLTLTIMPTSTPCLRCLFDVKTNSVLAQNCDTQGIILPIISAITAVQISEAIKILTKQYEKLHGTLLHIDIWENSYKPLKLKSVRKNSNCFCCVQGIYEFLIPNQSVIVSALCGQNSVQVIPRETNSVLDFNKLANKLHDFGQVVSNEFLIRFSADDCEMTVFPDGRAIIKNLDDLNVASQLYAKYIGNLS